MDTRTREPSTLSTDPDPAADAELGLAVLRLVRTAKEASRTTPGTRSHSSMCTCWSCRLGADVAFYEQAVAAHGRLWPGGDPVVS